jgi:ribosomal protein S3
LDTVNVRDVHFGELDAAGLAKQVAELLELGCLLRIAIEHRDDSVFFVIVRNRT